MDKKNSYPIVIILLVIIVILLAVLVFSGSKNNQIGMSAEDQAAKALGNKNNPHFTGVDATPPVVSLISPVSGSAVSGNVAYSANVTDNVGVSYVRFFVLDSNTATKFSYLCNTGFACNTGSTYSTSFDASTLTPGTYTLGVQAYDAAGNMGSTKPIPITVSSGVADTTKPTVSNVSPTSGSDVSGTVTFSAKVTDNVGVSYVRFFVTDSNLTTKFSYLCNTGSACNTGSTYSTSFDASTITPGSYILGVQAYDAAKNMGSSKPIPITIK